MKAKLGFLTLLWFVIHLSVYGQVGRKESDLPHACQGNHNLISTATPDSCPAPRNHADNRLVESGCAAKIWLDEIKHKHNRRKCCEEGYGLPAAGYLATPRYFATTWQHLEFWDGRNSCMVAHRNQCDCAYQNPNTQLELWQYGYTRDLYRDGEFYNIAEDVELPGGLKDLVTGISGAFIVTNAWIVRCYTRDWSQVSGSPQKDVVETTCFCYKEEGIWERAQEEGKIRTPYSGARTSYDNSTWKESEERNKMDQQLKSAHEETRKDEGFERDLRTGQQPDQNNQQQNQRKERTQQFRKNN